MFYDYLTWRPNKIRWDQQRLKVWKYLFAISHLYLIPGVRLHVFVLLLQLWNGTSVVSQHIWSIVWTLLEATVSLSSSFIKFVCSIFLLLLCINLNIGLSYLNICKQYACFHVYNVWSRFACASSSTLCGLPSCFVWYRHYWDYLKWIHC